MQSNGILKRISKETCPDGERQMQSFDFRNYPSPPLINIISVFG